MNKSIKITSPHSTQCDIQLDIYRALIMIYILCIIHVSFWLGAISEPMKSIILFEMPVIFYISGAALNVSNKRKSLSSTFVNRAKRVLAPYYAYAFFCIIVAIGYFFIGNENPKPIQSTILNALIPKDNSVPIPYTYHLWFVIPYFVISCSFYFQQIITDRINPYTYLFILLLSCIASQVFTDNNFIRNIFIYNFFFISGYLLYKKISSRIIYLIAAVSGSSFIWLYFLFWKGCMQNHKFPADMLFLSFGICSICILALILTHITIPYNKVLRWWNQNGYTIYLWQNIAFFVVSILLINLPDFFISGVIGFIFKSLSIFIIATALSIIAVPYENFFIKKTSLLFNRIVIYCKSFLNPVK